MIASHARAGPGEAATIGPMTGKLPNPLLGTPAPKRKPLKKTSGYWSNGVFVKDTGEVDPNKIPSRTEDKDTSHALQKLGLELTTLRATSFERLVAAGHVTERLAIELASYKRITSFEGKRRLGQLLGKLMRGLPDEAVAAIQTALTEQRQGSVSDTLAMHRAEGLRDALLADDTTMAKWIDDPAFVKADGTPLADVQRLRALVRQARKDMAAVVPEGQLRPSRAYKELYQTIRELLA